MAKQAGMIARIGSWLRGPLGRWGRAALVLAILTAPWVLFFNPVAPFANGHIPRDPVRIYRVYSDDFAFVSASRDFSRTVGNLFSPHNTHIVPAWRVLTWFLAACAGSLERVPDVLAVASYAILAATMMLMGRLTARETGREDVGAAAAVATGTTSLMLAPATWYAAGQPLWASFAALAALWYAQSWRRSQARPALALCAASTACAGWFWTIGHLAGPSAALYLWLDGRRSCRRAAAVPIAATVFAVGLSLILGAGKVDSRVSFHGRTAAEAAQPVEGFFHTMQAIPESLVLGNLGLAAETTAGQGTVLTLGLFAAWALGRLRQGGLGAFNPIEIAGAAFLGGSYLVEWTVRGYLDYKYLRTINVDMIVPWYHVAPQVGAVLFVVGWWSGPRTPESRRLPMLPPAGLTRGASLGVLAFAAVLVALNRPRVEDLWINSAPAMAPSEARRFPIPELQRMRAGAMMLEQAEHQRGHLRRFDLAEKAAKSMGIGLDAVHAAFGRVDAPLLPDAYDAAELLDLPAKGRPTDPARVRQALGPYLILTPPPRPAWYEPTDPWPPPKPKKAEEPARK
ncbi:hypothetical protein [Paludisphaera mucosa]|uniref:Glycosyltransferase RgtA/B/C/D-like domain-containing protein n=1 Tax=Paludisphaera mucosa TaxID=3030827 RepID=A0ABT6FGK7_9BACT|nr:hypothetical protein [Paludisphaera mucosa]MDG3006721.1 hypothetical protein [Paludisphaera mucosa]